MQRAAQFIIVYAEAYYVRGSFLPLFIFFKFIYVERRNKYNTN